MSLFPQLSMVTGNTVLRLSPYSEVIQNVNSPNQYCIIPVISAYWFIGISGKWRSLQHHSPSHSSYCLWFIPVPMMWTWKERTLYQSMRSNFWQNHTHKSFMFPMYLDKMKLDLVTLAGQELTWDLRSGRDP